MPDRTIVAIMTGARRTVQCQSCLEATPRFVNVRGAGGGVYGLEKPLSGASYRKEITSGLSGAYSGETRVVGRISGTSRQTRVCREQPLRTDPGRYGVPLAAPSRALEPAYPRSAHGIEPETVFT